MSPADRTLIILKPDALQRNLIGEILHRIEQEGLTIHRLETVDADRELVETHYREHREEDYFEPLVEYMTGRVIAGIVEGDNAARRVRALAGHTEPDSAETGTIRGDLASDSFEAADREGRAVQNLIHAAEPDDAADELALWFNENA